jgi:hypothetical protein
MEATMKRSDHLGRILIGTCCLSALTAGCGSGDDASEAATAPTLAPPVTLQAPASMAAPATTDMSAPASSVALATPPSTAIAALPAPTGALDETAPLLDDWELGRTLDLPGSGTEAFGDGSVWVVDEHDAPSPAICPTDTSSSSIRRR